MLMRKRGRTSIQADIRTFVYPEVIFRRMSSHQYTVSLFLQTSIKKKKQDYTSKNNILNGDIEALENFELSKGG